MAIHGYDQNRFPSICCSRFLTQTLLKSLEKCSEFNVRDLNFTIGVTSNFKSNFLLSMSATSSILNSVSKQIASMLWYQTFKKTASLWDYNEIITNGLDTNYNTGKFFYVAYLRTVLCVPCGPYGSSKHCDYWRHHPQINTNL